MSQTPPKRNFWRRLLDALRGAPPATRIDQAGGGVIAAQGSAAATGSSIAVAGNVNGDVVLIADPTHLWQAIRRRPPEPDLRAATERYLAHLVDRYRYLDFRGMGVSDRLPLRLPLVEMYVPLKARIELPEGETWARKLSLAGRQVSEEEAAAMGQRLSEPRPALDLLKTHSGLIVLGDPGAGKTTFVKYLALRLAQGEGDALDRARVAHVAERPGGGSAHIPILVLEGSDERL